MAKKVKKIAIITVLMIICIVILLVGGAFLLLAVNEPPVKLAPFEAVLVLDPRTHIVLKDEATTDYCWVTEENKAVRLVADKYEDDLLDCIDEKLFFENNKFVFYGTWVSDDDVNGKVFKVDDFSVVFPVNRESGDISPFWLTKNDIGEDGEEFP